MKFIIKYRIFLIAVIFFLGCAGAPPITVVDSVGRLTPNPSYNLADTQQTIFVSFWVALYEMKQDIDSTILVPRFIEVNKMYDIDLSKYVKMTLIMEVHNPKQIQYDLYKRFIHFNEDKQLMTNGGPAGISNLPHRSYEFSLPLRNDLKDCRYSITIHGKTKKGMVLVHVGEIQYSTHGGGD